MPNGVVEQTVDLESFRVVQSMFDIDNFRLAFLFDAQAKFAFLHPNPKPAHAVVNSEAKGIPPIGALPLSGQYLSTLTQIMGAKSELEMDVALENIDSLDVELILGAALAVLPKLAEERRQFDLVFIGVDFKDKWEQFDWAVKLTRPKGCVFLDDVVVSMRKNEQVAEGSESVLTKVGKDERVMATLVPVVATHLFISNPVFNGFIMAMVKDC